MYKRNIRDALAKKLYTLIARNDDLISYENPVTDQREWTYNGLPNLYRVCQQAVALHWDGHNTVTLILDEETLQHYSHPEELEHFEGLVGQEIFTRIEKLYSQGDSLRNVRACRIYITEGVEKQETYHLIPQGTRFAIGIELLAD